MRPNPDPVFLSAAMSSLAQKDSASLFQQQLRDKLVKGRQKTGIIQVMKMIFTIVGNLCPTSYCII